MTIDIHRRWRWLDRVCPIPNVFDSLEEWYRARHEDIALLTPHEIESERIRLRIRIAFEPRAVDPWLTERLERLRAAQRQARR